MFNGGDPDNHEGLLAAVEAALDFLQSVLLADVAVAETADGFRASFERALSVTFDDRILMTCFHFNLPFFLFVFVDEH
jgi:hypothetical protein